MKIKRSLTWNSLCLLIKFPLMMCVLRVKIQTSGKHRIYNRDFYNILFIN